jgi:thiamine kinase-like enzyme
MPLNFDGMVNIARFFPTNVDSAGIVTKVHRNFTRSGRSRIGAPEDSIHALDIWAGQPEISVLGGGMTNRNYLVRDAAKRCIVRLGEDIPVHHISRARELTASQAAHAAGLSPAVIHHQPGVLVLDYIDAPPLSAEAMAQPDMLERVVRLVRDAHATVGRHLRGPASLFWVFHVVADYAATLRECGSAYGGRLAVLLNKMALLEQASGPFEIVFGHNDLLASNFLDDGNRLWLIDWDYAGFNTPLFDLGGLVSNNGLSKRQESAVLELYHDREADEDLWRRYQAMKCASLLRETLWSMVSESHSTIDFDYAAYTAKNLARFEQAFDRFQTGERP